MLLQQLKTRLRNEYTILCTYLTTAPIIDGGLLSKAYEVVWKQEIVNLNIATLCPCLVKNNRHTSEESSS